jgi:hypothetical protein
MQQRSRHALISLVTSSLLLLTGCGGGGGGGDSASAPSAASTTFTLQSAFANFVIAGGTTSFTASTTVLGITCTGIASLVVQAEQPAYFRGAPVLDSTQTLTLSLNNCSGLPVPSGSSTGTITSRYHVNALRNTVLGISDDSGSEMVARSGGLALPNLIRAGDGGTLGILDSYAPGAPAPTATTTVTYSAVSDGDALRVLLTYDSAATGQPATYREVHTYRLDGAGVLRPLSIQFNDFSDGSSMTLAPNGP